MEITEMRKKMDAACGHTVKVCLRDTEKPIVGKCINYTKPLDNDPEVASFDIAVPNPYAETGRSLIEIEESEIESITLIDGQKDF